VNRRMRQRAFTLIELLLAVMVTVMIAVSTVAMLRSTDQTRRRVDRQMALQQETRAAVETMSTALRNASRTEDQGKIFEGLDAESDAMPADRVKFLTISPQPIRRDQPESDVKECEFFLQPSLADRPGMLMQRLDPTRNVEPDNGGVVRCIAQNIVALELAYHDGRSWRPEWSSETDGWPRAVRISLLAADPDDAKTTWPVESIVNFPRMPASPEPQPEKQPENQEAKP
jgi:type II secretory pathway component PulJ